MKKIFLVALTSSLLWACGNSNNTKHDSSVVGSSDSTQVAAVYQCPMDCEKGKTYEKEGKCPVCSMELELKNNE